MQLLLKDSVGQFAPHHFFHPDDSDFEMLAIPTNLRRQPFAFNAVRLALLFVVCVGFSTEKTVSATILPAASVTSSETLSYDILTEDFRTSQSIVKSLIGSFSRTDELFGDWISFDKIKNQTGATSCDQSSKTTRHAVRTTLSAPQQVLQSIQ